MSNNLLFGVRGGGFENLIGCVAHLFDDDVDRVALLRRRRAGVRPGVVDPGMIDRKPELKLSIATGIGCPALKQNQVGFLFFKEMMNA